MGCACGFGDVLVFEPVSLVDGVDHEVGEEADDEQAGHDAQDDLVAVELVHVVGDVVIEDAVDDEGADDACEGPCCKKASVDGGDVDAAEEVLEVGGDGGEASAVHGEEDDGDAYEEGNGVDAVLPGEGEEEVEDCSYGEEAEVGGFAADEVGDGGPEEAASHVEDAEQADEANSGNRTDGAVEEILDHGGGLLEDADTGGDIGEEDDPEEPELRGAPGVVNGDVVAGDERGMRCGGCPALGLPAVARDANGEDTEHHEYEIERSHGDEGVGDGRLAGGFEVGHELVGEGPADHGSAAEAHDGEAGGEAGAVGEPLDEGGDGRDVAESESDASYYAIAEVDERKAVDAGSDGRDEEAATEADCGVEHGAARTGSFEPRAEECGGDAEEGDGDGEDVADLFEVPGGAIGCVEGEQRILEDGEGVDLADGEMDGECGRRDEPAAISRGCDGAVSVEEG